MSTNNDSTVPSLFNRVNSRTRKAAALAACIGLAATGAVACSNESGNGTSFGADAEPEINTLGIDAPTADLAADPKGIAAFKRFFADRQVDTAVIASEDFKARLTASAHAVGHGLPLLLPDSSSDAEVAEALSEAGITKLVAFGQDVSNFAVEGHEFEISQADFGDEASEVNEAAPETGTTGGTFGADALTHEQAPYGLTPQGRSDTTDAQAINSMARLIASAISGEPPATEGAPISAEVFVTADTGLAAAANARAAGANVHLLPVGDPRATADSLEIAANGPFLALGEDFGPQEYFDVALDMAKNGEQPGGGGLVFPGRRMIALYGHPSGPALGLMGEQPPAEAVARVNEYVAQYQEHSDQQVIPAFEIIATIASDSPGDDGDYANESAPEDLVPYIDAITEAGGYAFLDLQPGRASLVQQAKIYEELLKRPNVGLALDPEWKIGPDEVPMTNIGHVQAQEVNEVADWLANLTRENNLPQKGLILHQFQVQMIRDREQINTKRPELAFILHADGHGPRGDKMATWDVMRKDLQPEFFMAWKNFIDEDTPMFTPQETYGVDPRPWFVSYQ